MLQRSLSYRKERRLGILLVAPTVIVLLGVLGVPLVFAAAYSLMKLNLASIEGFAGFGNWNRLVFTGNFVHLLVQTGIFVLGALIFTIVVSLPIAFGINRLGRRLSLQAQLVVMIPWVVSAIVGALLFRWAYLQNLGIASWFLKLFGVAWDPLTTSTAAMISMIIAAAWRTIGFAVVVFVAGIKAIDGDVLQAADIDGASHSQKLRFVTLPLMKTSITIVLVVLLLSNINNIEIPLVVTGGGPAGATNTLALETYNLAFINLDFGGSAAIATATAALNVALVLLYVAVTRRSSR